MAARCVPHLFLQEEVRHPARVRAPSLGRQEAASTTEDDANDVVRRVGQEVADTQAQCRRCLGRITILLVNRYQLIRIESLQGKSEQGAALAAELTRC